MPAHRRSTSDRPHFWPLRSWHCGGSDAPCARNGQQLGCLLDWYSLAQRCITSSFRTQATDIPSNRNLPILIVFLLSEVNWTRGVRRGSHDRVSDNFEFLKRRSGRACNSRSSSSHSTKRPTSAARSRACSRSLPTARRIDRGRFRLDRPHRGDSKIVWSDGVRRRMEGLRGAEEFGNRQSLTGEWILSLDADEVVERDLATSVIHVSQDRPPYPKPDLLGGDGRSGSANAGVARDHCRLLAAAQESISETMDPTRRFLA